MYHADASLKRANDAERIRKAQQLRSQGWTLFAIAEKLAVTKEWLRTYAGLTDR